MTVRPVALTFIFLCSLLRWSPMTYKKCTNIQQWYLFKSYVFSEVCSLSCGKQTRRVWKLFTYTVSQIKWHTTSQGRYSKTVHCSSVKFTEGQQPSYLSTSTELYQNIPITRETVCIWKRLLKKSVNRTNYGLYKKEDSIRATNLPVFISWAIWLIILGHQWG